MRTLRRLGMGVGLAGALAACRLFVDLDGLSGGATIDGTEAGTALDGGGGGDGATAADAATDGATPDAGPPSLLAAHAATSSRGGSEARKSST